MKNLKLISMGNYSFPKEGKDMIDLDKIENLTILYNLKEDKFGVKRTQYDLTSKERPYPILHVINPFDEDEMKETWDTLNPLTDKSGWMKPTTLGWQLQMPDLYERHRKIYQFINAIQVIYDADWFIDGRCNNSRCDGYDFDIVENYIENEIEVYEKLKEIFM